MNETVKTISRVFKNIFTEQKTLPITTATNNIKCLDFDMDKIDFKSLNSKSEKNLGKILPNNLLFDDLV